MVGFGFTLCSDLLGPELGELEEPEDDVDEDEEDDVEDVEDILLHKVSKVVLGGGFHFAARAAKIDILKL